MLSKQARRIDFRQIIYVGVIYFTVIFLIYQFVHPTKISPPRYSTSDLDGILHVGVLTYPKAHYLIKINNDRWANKFRKTKFFGGLHIVTDGPQDEDPSIPTIVYNPNDYNIDPNDKTWAWNRKPMVMKRILSAKYFYYNTTAGWYILMTDNAYIYTDNIGEMLRDFQTKYDPFKQSVVLGNCMSQGQSMAFLQGGTGWIMSRVAVRNFLSISEKWFNETKSAEDVHFAVAMKYMGLDIRESSTPYVIGQYCHREDFEMMEKSFNFTSLKPCPKMSTIMCKKCKPVLGQFRKIVFFHQLSLLRITYEPFPMSKYPENLYWYMCGEFPHFCRKDD
ncbi:hypothetical protein TRFO_21371 [Tritrichomonas foetus]|uniref:Uncharacterized protein n=1 Tax=Tritrichomonas foetus TaxID=1144522 RepID=A0A1J4KJY5_9EUKA|nr:hypothetical protein TRFO_21371 [Tritrichomonas foetus]|eukprot:OHT09653.1 hypothetical protein TRFO_21371 [Tritrichomonas foetus]